MKNWVLFIGTMIIVFGLGWLISDIASRKEEAVFAYKPKVEISTDRIEPRDSVWGLNYPRQYESYNKTIDTLIAVLTFQVGTAMRWLKTLKW